MATKKKARPMDGTKNFMLRVRMDPETLHMLDACCEKRDTTRSEFVREAIKARYRKRKKEQTSKKA